MNEILFNFQYDCEGISFISLERTRYLLQLAALGAGCIHAAYGVRLKAPQADRLNKQAMKRMLQSQRKGEGGYCYCAFVFVSHLPCMHLDPGVNRLRLNVTSVHQTDCRPVSPDIVFPICVILWPQEDELKNKKQSKTT